MSYNDNVLNYILVLFLVIMVCLYLKQQSGFKNNNKPINDKRNTNPKEVEEKDHNHTTNRKETNQMCSEKRKEDFVEFTNGKYCLGPVQNFHQSFNPVNMKNLGWRKWWEKHMNKNNLCEPNNFQPIMKNFLKNQENTNNIYF
jgi:hypothetical protein